MFVGEALCLLALMLLRSPLNPWRPQSRACDTPGTTGSATSVPAPLPKAKYRAISQSAPDDSGIVLDDDRFIHPARKSLAGALTVPRLVRQDSSTPFGAHGATPTPVPVTLDEDELEQEGEELEGRKTLLFLLPALFDIAGTTLMVSKQSSLLC